MKNLFKIFLFILVSTVFQNVAIGQWTDPGSDGTGDIYYENGNVGVGLSDPSAYFHLKVNTFNVGHNIYDGELFIESTGTTGNGNYGGAISFSRINADKKGAAIAAKQSGSDDDATGLAFFTHGNTFADPLVERMVIDHRGYIGIGTNAPENNFHLKNSTGWTYSIIEAGIDASAILELTNDAKTWQVKTDIDDNFVIRDKNSNAKRFVIDPVSGKIGIGTSTPEKSLHVKNDAGIPLEIERVDPGSSGEMGAANFTAMSTSGSLDDQFAVSTNYRIGINDDPRMVSRISVFRDGSNNSGAFTIKTAKNAVLNEALRVTSDGDVGIGTSSPGSKLDVAGTINASNYLINGSPLQNWAPIGNDINFSDGNVQITNGYLQTSRSNDNMVWWERTNIAQKWGINISSSGKMIFRNITASASPFVIDVNGNIGTGISAPDSKLHVYANDGNTNKLIVENGTIAQASIDLKNSTNNIRLITDNSNPFRIYDQNSGADRLLINGSGKVGIGTSSPDELLTVKGVIHAEKVKVDLNVPGPDYVFEEDYDLMSLDNISEYIRENKHLPHVPAAKEMEEEGVDVGNMNMILLRKVEELTLYILQQNDQLKDQNVRIKEQDEKINALINQVEQLQNLD